MTGLFNQADFYIGQQRQQITGGFGRHQFIQTGEQVQLGTAIGLQRGTRIELGKQFEPWHQHAGRRRRRAADQQAREPARVLRTFGTQQAKALEGDLGIGIATGQKRIKGFGRHRAGPAGMRDKARVARQRQQPTTPLAAPRCQLRGEHAAQGPTPDRPGIAAAALGHRGRPGLPRAWPTTPHQAQLQNLRTRLAMVFQHFNLWSHMSVLENITMAPRRVLGCSKKDAEDRARRYLHSDEPTPGRRNERTHRPPPRTPPIRQNQRDRFIR